MKKWMLYIGVVLLVYYYFSNDQKVASSATEAASVVIRAPSEHQTIGSTMQVIENVQDVATSEPELSVSIDDLNKYRDMEPEQILNELATLSKQYDSNISQVLLSLIESGDLDPLSSIRGEDDHYTPLYAAIILDNRLSLEQVKQFIALGSDISSMYEQFKRPWLSAIGRESNTDIAKLLLEQIDYSYEDANKIAEWAFISGNTETYNFLGSSEFIDKNKERLHELAFTSSDKLSSIFNKNESVEAIKNHSTVWLEKGSEEYLEWAFIESGKVAGRLIFLLNDDSLDENTRSKLEEALRKAEFIRDNLFLP